MKVMVKNFYRRECARVCVDYITRYNELLYDRAGNEMDHEAEREFVDKSRDYDYYRHLIISPEEKLSREQMDQATRDYVDFWLQESGRYGADYVYSIHEQECRDGITRMHAHVVLTSDPAELKVEREEASYMHELAEEFYREPKLELEKELIREEELIRELEKGMEPEVGLEMMM